MAKKHRHERHTSHDEHDESRRQEASRARDDDMANPPRTTRGPITAPKFGSAGSGGAELEPGPKKN